MEVTWDASKISTLLTSAFAPHLGKSKADLATAPSASIDVLITFDQSGVSGHPNHKSLYYGARTFVASLVAGKNGWAAPVDLYTLTSVSVARKYTGLLDVVATLASWALRTEMKNKAHPGGLVFLNGLVGGGAA